MILVDDLSTGDDPTLWLAEPLKQIRSKEKVFGENERIIFLLMPLSITLKYLEDSANYFKEDAYRVHRKSRDSYYRKSSIRLTAWLEVD